jgi:RNA polymerase sigma factor (sigma-70 family)
MYNSAIRESVMRNRTAEIFAGSFNRFKNYLRSTFADLNEYDAEDIVQQTALSMLGRDDGDENIEYLSAYIYTSLRNRAKNHFRKRKREVLSGDDIESGEDVSAEDEIIAQELNKRLSEALLKLDEKSRFVYEKTEFEDKSYKELSEETGEPIGTLLSRKNRAVKKLMMILDGYKDI